MRNIQCIQFKVFSSLPKRQQEENRLPKPELHFSVFIVQSVDMITVEFTMKQKLIWPEENKFSLQFDDRTNDARMKTRKKFSDLT